MYVYVPFNLVSKMCLFEKTSDMEDARASEKEQLPLLVDQVVRNERLGISGRIQRVTATTANTSLRVHVCKHVCNVCNVGTITFLD